MLWIPGALAESATDTATEVTEVVETAAQAVEEAVNLNIGMGEALMYAVIGFIIVFVVLFVIIGAIVLTSKFVNGATQKPAKEETSAPAPVVAAPVAAAPVVAAAPAVDANAPAPGSCGELKTYNVSDKDCAMIMAIVADEMKTPLNELRFISIKEIAE